MEQTCHFTAVRTSVFGLAHYKPEHTILAGHEKQLRPVIMNRNYSNCFGSQLCKSLFQRLCGLGHPQSWLVEQHRMTVGLAEVPSKLSAYEFIHRHHACPRPFCLSRFQPVRCPWRRSSRPQAHPGLHHRPGLPASHQTRHGRSIDHSFSSIPNAARAHFLRFRDYEEDFRAFCAHWAPLHTSTWNPGAPLNSIDAQLPVSPRGPIALLGTCLDPYLI